ncbi:SDR family oxidoreductase [Aeromicrobium sp. CTD01-1L150]|uniref:SDR family oxidoreductase n=1 Tax=Aeromicrobium sp. CTD01-1L150 TaxID=3341830 RepID=UPI0035BF1618
MSAVSVQGASAVVTGAAGGIGQAFARRLLEAGADVVLGDVDGDRLDETADALEQQFGERVHRRAVDVTSGPGVAALLEAAPRPVDLYVANAGVFRGFGLEATPQEWAASWDVNVMAHVEAARSLVPRWIEDGSGGCFVSVASAAGLLTQLGSPTYSVTKHAAVGFAEWLAASYGDRGVQVCCVCPMGVQTQMLEEGRESDDADATLGMRAVTTAGIPIEPLDVADSALSAVADGRFLALPHEDVSRMWTQKSADPDRWLAGMQRFRRSLEG